ICRILEFLPRDLGKALSGHVITTVQVETVAQCEVRCFQEPNCLSYNLGPYQTYEHTCELSNSDRVLHPNDLVPRPGYTYSGTEKEVTYNASLLYRTNGYRIDYNNIQFHEIMFVDEISGEKAVFTYKPDSTVVARGNYDNPLPELWQSIGVATTNYKYQLLFCN
ncbi:hypothetical protein pdam_00008736, partial [Pocillopora damicornis]